MNTKRILLCMAVAMAAGLTTAYAQSGGPFTLNWNTCDGGSGSCSGGVTSAGGTKFALTGTVAQPDANGSTAGTYVQQGGFIPAFTLPVTPALHMSISGTTLTFTWPSLCTGYVVEESPTLAGPWTPQGAATLNGPNWQVTVPASTSPVFFRLRKDCPK